MAEMQRRFRLEVLLVVAIVLVTTVFARWHAIPTYADRHVAIAEERYEFEVGDPGPWFSAWSLGDGTAYVLIAIDPTGEHLAREIPEAGYRFARAGYGWAVWGVTLGRPELVPYALAIVGLIAVAGVLAIATLMRPRLGPRSWLMVLNPALFIGIAADTSEPIGILLLAIALMSGSWIAAVLLGVTRPTFLVSLWSRWRLLISGIVAGALLGLYSLVVFGIESLVPAGGRLTFPLVAYAQHLSVWGLLLAFVAIATIAIGLRNRDWSWVLTGLFVVCFGPDVLRDPVNAWRAAGLIPVLWAFGPNFDRTSSIVADEPANAESLNVY